MNKQKAETNPKQTTTKEEKKEEDKPKKAATNEIKLEKLNDSIPAQLENLKQTDYQKQKESSFSKAQKTTTEKKDLNINQSPAFERELEDLRKEEEKLFERQSSENTNNNNNSSAKITGKYDATFKKKNKFFKRSSTVNPAEAKMFSDYFKNLYEDPAVDLADVITYELGEIKNTINNVFKTGNLDAAIIGYHRGYDQYKLILKTAKDNLHKLPESKKINFFKLLPSVKKLGRDFLRNTGAVLLKKDNYNDCIENDLFVK